jgi:toxin-antitoxin system PIN domain toxin
MTSCDTNILFPALEASHSRHTPARAFLEAQANNSEFALCELVLMEVYVLLRNPLLVARPLDAATAVRKIDNLRRNPNWALLDYPGGLMDEIWNAAARSAAFRRIFDIRLAVTLRHHGVREFATANVKDFETFGFERVWNPLAGS